MQARAAVLWGVNEPWQIEEVELDDPEPDEVLISMTAAGLCHSDEHIVTGDIPMALPAVGGHEGSAVVEKVGEPCDEPRAGRPRRHELHPELWPVPPVRERSPEPL